METVLTVVLGIILIGSAAKLVCLVTSWAERQLPRGTLPEDTDPPDACSILRPILPPGHRSAVARTVGLLVFRVVCSAVVAVPTGIILADRAGGLLGISGRGCAAILFLVFLTGSLVGLWRETGRRVR